MGSQRVKHDCVANTHTRANVMCLFICSFFHSSLCLHFTIYGILKLCLYNIKLTFIVCLKGNKNMLIFIFGHIIILIRIKNFSP